MSDLSPLIAPDALAARLADPQVRIVDCRFDLADTDSGRRQYEAGHVPGAVYAHLDRDLSGPIGPTTGRHPLPAPAQFARTLARWGIVADTTVVAYDQGPGAMAARLWWLLRAVGHSRAQVLEGGLAAWQAAGLPVSTEEPPARTGAPGPARPFTGWLTTAEVQAGLAAATLRLVDARAADRFAGRNETIDPVPGHVPGAVNHPFASNLGSGARFLAAAELAQRWSATLGGTAPRDAVMMCGSGVTACHNLLALEVAGLRGARLYAGSYSEWIRDSSRPVATGGAN
jgi:thiosulfate/3-mercaptopyruvate sulfurtransferase